VLWRGIAGRLLRLAVQLLKKSHRKQVITSSGENPKQVNSCAFVVGELEEQDSAGAWLQECRC